MDLKCVWQKIIKLAYLSEKKYKFETKLLYLKSNLRLSLCMLVIQEYKKRSYDNSNEGKNILRNFLLFLQFSGSVDENTSTSTGKGIS